MKNKIRNFAFIDSQNLNLSIRSLGWKLNFKRFRIYLKDKYQIEEAYLFLGYVPGHDDMYASLQKDGYICIFKPTLTYKNGKTKGNCDAELVLHTMIELENYDRAVIVTGDGDFHCLIKYLISRKKLEKILVPDQSRYSALLKRFDSHYLAFVSDLRNKLEYKRKEPHKDKTLQGAFCGDI